MGIFTRLSDIVQANVHSILDKAEDPLKMVKLLIEEMHEAQAELRAVAATHIAEQRQLQKQLTDVQGSISSWADKAERALANQREDLARLALQEKQQATQHQLQLEQQLATLKDALDTLSADSERLQQKIQEARTKQQSLLARERTASVRIKVRERHYTDQIDNAVIRFEQFERKIDDLEAQVDAYDLTHSSRSLHSEFDDLVAQDKIEQELAALKAKVA